MQVRLLGPVDVAVNGESRPVNGLRRKAVLATLALHDGQVVSTGRLVDVVWGESAPPMAANTLQSHISYLRGVLGSRAAILARPPGYLLNLGGDGTDAGAAERLLRRGRQAADPAQGARQLRAALALWRGRPLADVTGSAWLEEQSQRLELLADEVRRALFEARLAAGEHAELVPGLERMAAGDPLDEQVHGQLMLALYRCGRQADALTVFGRLRAALAEQLGVDPSPMLRDLQTAILRQDGALAAVRQTGDTAGEAHVLVALAMGHARAGRNSQAEPLFHQALGLLETAGGYPCGRAVAHSGLTWLAEHRQRPADMLRHAQAAYALYRAAGDELMQMAVISDIGYCHALAGDYQQAISYCERALPAIRELGDVSMEASTLHSLGYIHHQLGSCQRAIACYERSAALSRDLADLCNEAGTLSLLGTVHQSTGDLRAARRAWARALRIFEETGHPEAWRIRARLRTTAGQASAQAT